MSCTPCTTGCLPKNPCPSYPNAECVVYTGSNLPCIGVVTNTRLDSALTNINTAICSISQGINIQFDGVGQGKANTLNFVGATDVETSQNLSTITISSSDFGVGDSIAQEERSFDFNSHNFQWTNVPTGTLNLSLGLDASENIITYAPINIWKAILTCGYQTGQVSATTTTYGQLTGNNGGFQAENFKEYVIPENCNVRNLFITTTGTQPASGSLVVTIRHNLSDTLLSITIPAGSTAASYSNVTDNFDIVAGDILTIQFINNASSGSITITSSGVTLLGTGL